MPSLSQSLLCTCPNHLNLAATCVQTTSVSSSHVPKSSQVSHLHLPESSFMFPLYMPKPSQFCLAHVQTITIFPLPMPKPPQSFFCTITLLYNLLCDLIHHFPHSTTSFNSNHIKLSSTLAQTILVSLMPYSFTGSDVTYYTLPRQHKSFIPKPSLFHLRQCSDHLNLLSFSLPCFSMYL